MTAQTGFRFDRYELWPQARELRCEGRIVVLGGRAFDLLVALVERAGQVVDAQELFDLVWGQAAVETANLQVQVWTLRRVLGAGSIATVARRGYRFVPTVRALVAAPGGEVPAPVPAARRRAAQTPLTLISTDAAAAEGLAQRLAREIGEARAVTAWWVNLAEGRPARAELERLARAGALLVVVAHGVTPSQAGAWLGDLRERWPTLALLVLAGDALRYPGETLLVADEPAVVPAVQPVGHPLRWAAR